MDTKLRKNFRLIIQISLVVLILLFSTIYLTIASNHELIRYQSQEYHKNISDQSLILQSIGQLNYRTDNSTIEILISITIPVINQDNQEFYANLTKTSIDILYIEEFHPSLEDFTVTKNCGLIECTSIIYEFSETIETKLLVIYTRMTVSMEFSFNSNDFSIYFETDNLSYMKELGLIYGFLIILLLFVILVIVSLYKRKIEFPDIQKDEHFHFSFLIEEFVRKRLLLKVFTLFIFFGYIIYEHNPHLFDTNKWYSTDMVYFSIEDFNGIEFFIMLILYSFIEVFYLGVVYWKDDDLRQWISFIDTDKELALSVQRIFIHPLYFVIFPILLAFFYHNQCGDCGNVAGMEPRIGDYNAMIEVLRIQVGFLMILLYTQYAKTRAR